jgi:inosine/xanthosine triphosphate pyrophosphatase family protein
LEEFRFCFPATVAEDGATFEENARKKAEDIAWVRRMVVADDSGRKWMLNGSGVHL